MRNIWLGFGWVMCGCLILGQANLARGQDDVRLTEFMASNSHTLLDDTQQYSDWIEIYNAGTNTVNLLNWALTDSPANLNKWLFPSTNIAAGKFMIIFASGFNHRIPGAPLHTSFKLGAGGEYLALVRPDGTIATEFSPAYPPQAPDVSYGFSITQNVFTVVATNAAVRALVPTDGSLGNSWLFAGFDDSGWISGTNGIGFDTGAVNPSEDLATSIILGSGPLAYWRFNETTGIVATNISVNNLNGTYQNVALNIAGPRPATFGGFEANNTAAQFNGSSSFVGTGSNFMNGLGAFTMAGWVRPSVTPAARAGLFGQSGVAALGFLDATTVQIMTGGGGSLSVSNSLTLNAWHYVAVVGDGSNLRIYFEGVLQGTGGTATANYGISASPFNIGGGGVFDASGNFFTGQIDEVAVWGRALSAAEIQQQYATAKPVAFNPSFANLIRTDLRSAMLGVNSSAYARFTFTLADPSQVDLLVLRAQYDDGFVAYLNGVPVAVANAPDYALLNPLPWNTTATAFHQDSAAVQFEEFNLASTVNALTVGTNVLAIQGLNTSATNSDFLIRVELTATTVGAFGTQAGYFKQATPGNFNGLSTTDIGPTISHVGRTPGVPIQPAVTDSITVTARVAKAFSTVTNAFLTWRVMYGPTNTVQMFDDGSHGDGAAGDGVYGATIPAGVATPGQMLRWIVWAQDAAGHLSRWPLFENPTGSAEYEGTVILDTNLTSMLPIYQIFIDPNSTNWIKPFPSGLPTVGVDSPTGGRLSLFNDGEFYDNIHMSVRGNTTAGYPKNSHHINFNTEKPLKYPGPGGTIRHTSFLSEQADPSYLRTHLSFWLLSLMGVPATFDYPVRFQLNGSFYGLYFHNDALGADELSHLGYDPDGALYKAAGTITPDHSSTGVFEKRTRLYENTADFDALAAAVNEARPAGTRKTNIFDILNIPEIVNYMAVERWNVEGDDVWANMSMYRDSNNTKEWFIVPFDLNVSWGQLYCGDVGSVFINVVSTNDLYKCHPLYGGSQIQQNTGSAWNRLYDVIIATPETRQMLLRRQRTLLDKFIQPPGTTFAQGILEQHISYITNLMWTEMFLDRQKWQSPCSGTCGMYCWGALTWPTNADYGVPGLINEFINPRRAHWFNTHSITNTARGIGLSVTNSGGIPLSQPGNTFIAVQSLESNPSSGNQAQEYVCLTNPAPLAIDISGWKISGAVDFTFKPGTVMPSNSVIYVSPDVVSFRARTTGPRGGQALFVVGPYSGQLSARGETIRITDDLDRPVSSFTYGDASSPAQKFLRITELMYHPAPLAGNTNDPEEFEYIEFKNISTNITLDLTGVRFTNGVEFSFTGSAITTLGPGQRALIVKNPAAFAARYGSVPNIAGTYMGSLNNGGERIQLVDAAGEEILDFSYNNSWYPITDGLGFSLVVVDEQAQPDSWDSKTNWQPSGQVGGSPGTAEPSTPPIVPVIINEALTRNDSPPPSGTIELFNPTANSADLSGWFLSDDFATPKKYRIADGTSLPGGGYLTFTDSQFNPQPGIPPSFALNGAGGAIYLFSANPGGDLTGYFHGFTYGAAESGVSFGRYVTSEGKEHFVAQLSSSLGATNAGPRVGPVVVSEIMYHPPDVGTNDDTVDEFIELLNTSSSPVALFDAAQPLATWTITGGIGFTFPTNVVLAAGEYIIVGNFDVHNSGLLAAFRARYGLAPGIRVFGPYSGKLNNNGDNIELKKPTTILNGRIPFVQVDKVEFQDSAPWPHGADGFGLSLQRRSSLAYGDDPANWFAAPPSAGAPASTGGTAPSLTTQPADQAVVGFSMFSLSVTAAGDGPLRYQWRLDGANLPGATNATLQFSSFRPQDAGNYDVVAYNNAGSAVSSNATLTVIMPASILFQPQNLTVFPRTNASLSVLAYSVSALGYQWRFNGTNITGATNASLTLTNIQPADDGLYSVAVTDAVGTNFSDSARLAVTLHPVFTLQPTNRTVIVRTSTTNITMTAGAFSTSPVSYQWQFSGSNIPGATNSSLVLSNLAPENAGGYSVVATDGYGTAGSSNATLTLIFIPVFIQNPQSQIAALGGNATFTTVLGGTPPITFRWRRPATLSNGFFSGFIVSGPTNSSLTLTNLQASDAAAYTVAVANLAGNDSRGGFTPGLSSNGYLYVLAPPADQTVAPGSDVAFTTALFGITNAAVIAYQWGTPAGPLPGATNTSLTLTNVQPAASGSYSVTVTIVTNGYYVPPATFAASLLVLPPNTPPVLRHIPDYTVDEHVQLKFSAAASDTDLPPQILTFSLEAGAPSGAAISSSGLFKWRPNEMQGPGFYQLAVRVTDNGSPSLSATQTFAVTVNEVNSAPLFPAIKDKYVKAGTLLTFPTAVDSDWPPQNLAFTIDPGLAQGATIGASSGIVSWTPTDAQAPTNYPVQVRVVDDGIPPLGASTTFTIHVLDRSATLILVEANRSGNSLQLSWASTVGKSYQIQYKLDPTSAWVALPPAIVAVSSTTTFMDTVGADHQRFYRVVQLP